MTGFRIQHTEWQGKLNMRGFQITGKSGNTVSVQFGHGNYSSARNSDSTDLDKWEGLAETAVIGPDGKFIPQDSDDDVQGWQTPADVAALIAKYID